MGRLGRENLDESEPIFWIKEDIICLSSAELAHRRVKVYIKSEHKITECKNLLPQGIWQFEIFFSEYRLWLYENCLLWEKYYQFVICWIFSEDKKRLIHVSLEIPKPVIGKQCRPRSDATECSIWSGSPLFADILAQFL